MRRIVLVAILGLWLGAASALGATPQLPDLLADPPEGGVSAEPYTDPQGSRLLLRLDGFVHNIGPGALEIRGSDPVNLVMTTVRQRVYDDGGGFADVAHAPEPSLIYETNDDHHHWHLYHAMRYSLWSADRTMEVAPAQKVGFCLQDTEPIEASPSATPTYTEAAENFCQSDLPTAPTVYEGISAGWRDLYPYVLAFQWVDVSDVDPGRYWLRADADPDNVIAEADENNVGAYDHDMSVVNGYRADPVDAGSVPPLGPTTIALQTTTFDDAGFLSPGPREFEVVTPPAGGTLDQPAGTWFSAASVQYTPNPGFSGPDSFTVAARDASSPYPLHPRSAAVTLNVQSTVSPTVTPVPYPGTLGISGAPVRVYTASTTPLSADGPGVEQGVTWSVDGTVGGSAASGTISADGVFHAPAAVPPAGRVVVGARSATGATGQVSIGIGAAPHPRPAPGIKPPAVPAHGLSRIKLREHARTVLAVVSSAQRGRVRFVGRIRGRRFGGCSTRVSRGGAATCKMRAPATNTRTTLLCRISRTLEVALPPITVRASLTHGGRVVARRHAAL